MHVYSATLTLARATGQQLGTITEALVESMKAFGISATDAERAASILLATSYETTSSIFELNSAIGFAASFARRFGLTLADTGAALAMLTAKGVSATVAGRRFAAFLDNLITRQEDLGFAIYDATGELLPFYDIVRALRSHVDEFATAEERAAYLSEIFGRQGMHVAEALISVDASGRAVIDVLEENAIRLEENAEFAKDVADTMMETLPAAIDRAKAAFSILVVKVGEAVTPAISRFVDKLEDITERQDVIDMITSFARAFIESLFAALEKTVSILRELLGGITSFINNLGLLGPPTDEAASKVERLGAA